MTGRRWVRAIGRALPCLLMASLLVTLGCKAGANNNDGSGPLPCTNLSFTRALSSPANGDVYLQGVTSTCSTIDVSVDVANLSGIFTVGFDLTFPSSIVSYQTFFKGSLLQKNNPATPPYFLVTNPSPGSLQVAMSRFA